VGVRFSAMDRGFGWTREAVQWNLIPHGSLSSRGIPGLTFSFARQMGRFCYLLLLIFVNYVVQGFSVQGVLKGGRMRSFDISG